MRTAGGGDARGAAVLRELAVEHQVPEVLGPRGARPCKGREERAEARLGDLHLAVGEEVVPTRGKPGTRDERAGEETRLVAVQVVDDVVDELLR